MVVLAGLSCLSCGLVVEVEVVLVVMLVLGDAPWVIGQPWSL